MVRHFFILISHYICIFAQNETKCKPLKYKAL